MSQNKQELPVWVIGNLQTGQEFGCSSIAYWEVSLDPISDDYTPDEISAKDLLSRWVGKVRKKYPDGLIPIYWFVQCEEKGIFEWMPFQRKDSDGFPPDGFLQYYTYPIDSETEEPANWLTLPVADKLWNAKQLLAEIIDRAEASF